MLKNDPLQACVSYRKLPGKEFDFDMIAHSQTYTFWNPFTGEWDFTVKPSMKVGKLRYKRTHCSFTGDSAPRAFGHAEFPSTPPADPSLLARLNAERHQSERTNERYEKWPKWFSPHVAWREGKDRYAALFQEMKEWANGLRERGAMSAEKRKAAGAGFWKDENKYKLSGVFQLECRESER